MAHHAASGAVRGGFLGVDVFFVLSGFLITSLLLGEHARTGTIRLRDFYARRALRLFPALACVIVFVLIAALTSGFSSSLRYQTLIGLPAVVFYAGNWLLAFGPRYSLGALSHTWSLAIEEQFYLLWPFALLFVIARAKRRKVIALGLFTAALLDMAYRVALVQQGASALRVYGGLDTHFDGLLVGCAIAFWLSDAAPEARHSGRVVRRMQQIMAYVAIMILVVMVVRVPLSAKGVEAALGPSALCSGAILWTLLTDPPRLLQAVLASRPAVWVGRRSYGLYLWHWPIFILLANIAMRSERLLLQFAVSFAAATISYRFVEQPFLRLKRRFQRNEASETLSAPSS